MQAFRDHLVFFFTPTDLASQALEAGRTVRVGGLVEKGSVQTEGAMLHFTMTDMTTPIAVYYEGIPPALFREGQGVVVETKTDNITHEEDGTLILHADNVLAKHDERYMPREVADALKESGHWQEYSESDSSLTTPLLFTPNAAAAAPDVP